MELLLYSFPEKEENMPIIKKQLLFDIACLKKDNI